MIEASMRSIGHLVSGTDAECSCPGCGDSGAASPWICAAAEKAKEA